LASKDVAVAIATDASKAPTSGSFLFNPDRKSVNALDAPSTPMFFLVDSQGVLRNMWMGYSSEESGKMHSDLFNAIAGTK
jgi:hypothetical protein